MVRAGDSRAMYAPPVVDANGAKSPPAFCNISTP